MESEEAAADPIRGAGADWKRQMQVNHEKEPTWREDKQRKMQETRGAIGVHIALMPEGVGGAKMRRGWPRFYISRLRQETPRKHFLNFNMNVSPFND